MSKETFEVSKKEYLGFQISKKEAEIAKADSDIEKLKRKKEKLKEEIRTIKEENRDVFPARGRKRQS
jgi:hypothetical protein